MKNIITLLILILFSMHFVSAQESNPSSLSPQALRNFYMQKSKTKTITAFALLIVGVIMANEGNKISGNQFPSSHIFSEVTTMSPHNRKLWLLPGKAMTLASIPYFIYAGKKKEQASQCEKKVYSHW